MEPYKHIVQYYETDRMGITHHSNYVRWMEEARVDFLNKIGWGYEKLEAEGIYSPVTAIECKYRSSTTFADEVIIEVSISEFKGVVLKFRYRMVNKTGHLVFEGHSEHCFLNFDGKVTRLRKDHPELHDLLVSLVREE